MNKGLNMRKTPRLTEDILQQVRTEATSPVDAYGVFCLRLLLASAGFPDVRGYTEGAAERLEDVEGPNRNVDFQDLLENDVPCPIPGQDYRRRSCLASTNGLVANVPPKCAGGCESRGRVKL